MTPVFIWVLLTLAVYRLVRFITYDSFPPMFHLRRNLQARMGDEWGELLVCPWCVSVYLVPVVYLITAQLISIPLPVLQVVATLTICGLIGNHDS